MSNVEPIQAWRRSGFIVTLLVALSLGVYWETLKYLLERWNQFEVGEYGHGYLVLGISIYLIYSKVRRLIHISPATSPWGLLVVASAGLLWLVSAVAYVEMMQAVALWLMLFAIVLSILGWRITLQLLFPLLFIAFALPIWFPLSPLLQEWSADVVFWLVRLLEVPAFRQEALIVLPAGMLSIEEACSGLRYLLAALTLSTLYGYLNFTALKRRLMVVLVAAVAAVILNFVRVFIVVYLAYVTEMQHPFVHDHLMLGWYLFAGMMIVLLLIDARLSRSSEAPEEAVILDVGQNQADKQMHPWLMLLLSGLLIVAAPAAIYQMDAMAVTNSGPQGIVAPNGRDGWRGVDSLRDDWMPTFHGALTARQTYQKDDQEVHLFLGYYPRQQQGKELINVLNRISVKNRWRNRFPRGRVFDSADHSVLEQVLEKGGVENRLVWYWYEVAGHRVTSKYTAKLMQVVGKLSGRPQASVIALATRLDDKASARKRLESFITTMQPSLSAATEQYQ
ncbi:MAG: EpsI family protein [Gammaproteobacteria bacterium]|nr:EpsI family protein [Gammaproteobacteria bacterium]